MSVCTWNDIDCGINYNSVQSCSLKSFICYMPSVSEVELWKKIPIMEVFCYLLDGLGWAIDHLEESLIKTLRSQCRQHNFEMFLKTLMAKKMHCCILDRLKFPVSGLSGEVMGKIGQQRKESMPEPFCVCYCCLLQIGVWRWTVVVAPQKNFMACGKGWQEGWMREVHDRRLQ